MKKFVFALCLLSAALQLQAAPAADEARLLRFPAVGGGKIVFCYAGNLYAVDINGGRAVKLTSDVGYECFPKVSPDGKTVVDTSYVRLIDGVKPEMMRADYWIKEGNDKVLMTPEEITVFNKNNRGVITAKDKTKFPKLD